MPVHPADAAHAGFGLALDYLTGSSNDEVTGGLSETNGAWLEQRVEQVLGAGAVDRQALLELYQQQRPELNQSQTEMAMIGDIAYRTDVTSRSGMRCVALALPIVITLPVLRNNKCQAKT